MLLGGKQRTEDFTEEIMAEILECAENIKLGAANFTFQNKNEKKKSKETSRSNTEWLLIASFKGKIGTGMTTGCLDVC